MSEDVIKAKLSILRGYSREFSELEYTDRLRVLDEMHDLLHEIEKQVQEE